MTLSLKTKSAREPRGYYRRPVIGGDQLFFIAEGDIWQATCQKASAPSAARRLTGSTGAVSSLVLSPAGDRLFFVGTDEGAHELYSLCLGTGEQKRLTYLGGDLEVLVLCKHTEGGIFLFALITTRLFPVFLNFMLLILKRFLWTLYLLVRQTS